MPRTSFRAIHCLICPFIPVFAAACGGGDGGTGIATLRVGSRPYDLVSDAARTSSGGVLVTGTLGITAVSQAFVARLLSDGTLDASFGEDGLLLLPAGSAGYSVAEHPEGGAVVAGLIGPADDRQLMVARITSEG